MQLAAPVLPYRLKFKNLESCAWAKQLGWKSLGIAVTSWQSSVARPTILGATWPIEYARESVADRFFDEKHMKNWSPPGSANSVLDRNAERSWAANTPVGNYRSVPEPVGPKPQPVSAEPHWNFAFVGLMFYAFIEYSRLPEMYPVFHVFQLGKSRAHMGRGGVSDQSSDSHKWPACLAQP